MPPQAKRVISKRGSSPFSLLGSAFVFRFTFGSQFWTANEEPQPASLEPNLKVNTNREARTRKSEQQLAIRRAEVGYGELQVAFAIPRVLLE